MTRQKRGAMPRYGDEMKRDYEVYLRAAELVDAGVVERSCLAIYETGMSHGHVGYYWKWFGNSSVDSNGFSTFGDEFGLDANESRNNRVLALLFMAEIVRKGK